MGIARILNEKEADELQLAKLGAAAQNHTQFCFFLSPKGLWANVNKYILALSK